MTELIEKIAVTMHPQDDEECPFCPGEKEKDWTTVKGEQNDSGKLRNYMNKPSTNNWAQQRGARPKDGKDGRQAKDPEKTSPAPIYSSSQCGDYGDQAHHLISGNEIMKGHKIEQVITKGSNFQSDTGYTINNCGNGVYLPAYPKNFSGTWGSRTYPKTYSTGSGSRKVNNVREDQDFKLEVMKPAMDSVGQAHIGGHEGFYIEGLDGYEDSYPSVVKKKLSKILDRVKTKGGECPFCFEGDKPQKPFIAPYRVNQWLDNLSEQIEKQVTGPSEKWTYFISQIALDYGKEVKRGSSSAMDDFD